MLCKEGRVHNSDVLDAVLKGFEVDTTNFRINTLHTERWMEPNTNLQSKFAFIKKMEQGNVRRHGFQFPWNPL